MSTRYCAPLILLLLGGLVPRPSQAATVNAASCSVAHVQAAVDAANVGDTVHLPTCTYNDWATTVTITKRIILEGNGRSNTILQRARVYADFPVTNPMFFINNVTGFEMREMTLDGTYDTDPNEWRDMGVRILNCVDFRFHHMDFTDIALGIFVQHEATVGRGLIDHNTFTNMRFVNPMGGALGYGVELNGNGTYPALSLGTATSLFVEDNIFTNNRHAIASNNGSRYTFRYNTIIRTVGESMDAAAIDAHGDTSSWDHGSRQYEIYHNSVTDTVEQCCGVGIRGGDGVIWNNVFSPMSANREIYLLNDSGCSGSDWPRFDQIRDLYVWGNTRHGGAAARIVVHSGCEEEIQTPRDYKTIARPGYGTGYTYPHPGQGGLSPVADFTTALRMHLKFDEGTLTTAQDSTVNNHDGTLANGATWGAPTMGASALSLDGVNDEVNVTGLLSSPAAITLAAWILPSTYGTGGADVISVGNVVMVRVTATTINAHYWNGTSFTTLAASRPASSQWQHVAVTIAPNAQRLYLNGDSVASASAGAGIGWTGQGSNTFIGTHGNGGTATRYGGLIDDVRVYTRALTNIDIAGLANLEDPPPLSIQITTPTTSPSYSTTTALLANLGGVATDETGVTGITWNCPTCATTSGPATCTPACGASTEDVNWNIPSITLAPGSNVITVTAADASGTRPDSLTVTYTAPPVTGGAACTHYAASEQGSPPGLSGNAGTQGSPYRVADFWIKGHATPGKVLCLLDGTYAGGNNLIHMPATVAGTLSQPITIRAKNDGKVLLDAGLGRAFDLQGSHAILEGINAKASGSGHGQFVGVVRGSHLLVRRVNVWSMGPGIWSDAVLSLVGDHNTLEDCGTWGYGRKILSAGSGAAAGGESFNRIRRCWVMWNGHPSPEATGPHEPFEVGYDQDGIHVENSLVTWHMDNLGEGHDYNASLFQFSSERSSMRGSISYQALGSKIPTNKMMAITGTGGFHAGDTYSNHTRIADFLTVMPPGHAQFATTTGIIFDNAQNPNGDPADNLISGTLSIGGAIPPSCHAGSWTGCNTMKYGTSVANALAQYPAPQPATVFHALPGICKRYVDGVLTTQGLWPWPMNQRIIDGLVQSGRAPIDISATIKSLLGQWPAECESGAVAETCPPPHVGTPPTCSCPAGTVEPNCEPETPPVTCPPDCPVQDVFVIATTGSPGPAGSDAAGRACTLEQPCATIARARPLMTPGDTLYLRGGTYTGAANRIDTSTGAFPPGNDWTSPTRLAGYGGETAILQQSTDVIMRFRNPSTDRYLVLDRLTCDGASTPSNNTQCISVGDGAHHIRLQNLVVRNTHFGGITIENVNNVELLTSLVHGATHASGIDIGGTSDTILLDGNTVHSNANHGINTSSIGLTNLTLTKNIVRNNVNTGIQIGAQPCLVTNNLVHSNSLGIRLVTGTEACRLYHNTIADNSGVELQIDAGAVETLVTNTLAVGGITDNGTGTAQTTNYTGVPGFVGGGDYHLALDTSPAADAGTCLPGEVDGALDGIARPQPPGGECDIGAYERAGDEAEEPVPGVLSGRPWRSKMLLLPQ